VKVRILGVVREYHAACIVDWAFGLKDWESTKAILEWMGDAKTGL
jgi:hypothetical protein